MRYSYFISLLFFSFCATTTSAQSLAINTDGSTANASALLDVKSTAKGVLVPRMSRTERDAIATPATGLLIFQNGPDSMGFHYYDGTQWTWLVSNSNADSLAWKTAGNTGTTDAANFIGTRDNIPFNIRVNNQKAGRIDNTLANTILGYQAANANTSGQNNAAFGQQALLANLSGTNNTALGGLASRDNTTGGQNTATGYGSSILNTVGQNNTAYGFYSLYNNVAGSGATAIGYQSMLYANNTATPFGNNNVAVGFESLRGSVTPANNTGVFNTAIGYQTLLSNNNGGSNTAVGFRSLNLNTSGISNTGIGAGSLVSNTTGSTNTATGQQALNQNSTGSANTATGQQSLNQNTTGYGNVATGARALWTNQTGNNQVAIGDSALFSSTLSANTAVGSKAGYLNTGSNNVFLGYQAGYNETGSNKLYIANNSTNPPIIYGDFSNKTLGFGTITPNSSYGFAKVEIASEGFLAPADLLIRNAADNAGYAPGLIFQHARGTLATPVAVNNGDFLSAINTLNYDGTNYITSAGLDMYADGAIAAGIVPTRLQFATMNTAGAYSYRMTIKNDGKVGIGITDPLSRTHINNGNFLVTGDGTSPAIEPTGAGTRLFFYPLKYAFRAGYVNSTQWDDANIGQGSIGLGFNALASNLNAIAMGENSQAKSANSVSIGSGNITETEQFAVAIGRNNHSTGYASVAMGHFSEATGHYSVSFGLRDTVSGFAAAAIGGSNKVFADGAFAGGNANTVTANYSFAGGHANAVSGSNSFAGGLSNTVSGSEAFAGGNNNTVSGNSGVALGRFNYSPSFGEVTVGLFATQYSPVSATAFNANDRIFTIGNGTGTGSRSNAMVVLKNGNTGLGTAAPNSTLHVDGTIAMGTSLNIAGGPSGTPISLLNQKSYVGVLPANGTDNYYQLPDPTVYPGRTYIIRNNSSVDPANITTAAGLLFPGNSSAGGATYTLNPNSSPKTVMAISDGANWTIMVQN